MRLTGTIVGIVMILVGSVVPACAPRASFESPDPTMRLNAVQRAVEADDRSSIPHLIVLLDSDDAAVRLFAIQALERFTGQTFGYCHAGPEAERHAAADRWAQWYREQSGNGAWGPPGRTGPADAAPNTP